MRVAVVAALAVLHGRGVVAIPGDEPAAQDALALGLRGGVGRGHRLALRRDGVERSAAF
jgi:hypothetical protein